MGVVRERLGQHLQRHVPIELRISRSIHLPHAAFADLGGDRAAVLLGVSEREVWGMLQRGELTRVTIPGKRMTRIAREDLDRLVNQWRQGVS